MFQHPSFYLCLVFQRSREAFILATRDLFLDKYLIML
jgi:hypothetical protein